jgi:4-amino-4-deoxy-L-arabinose transferase-like glycosyltransferase
MQRVAAPFLKRRYSWIIAAIIMLGCVIRVVACVNTCVIVNDGVFYIHQANTLYHDGLALSLGRSYLSLYPLLIAGAYFLVGDWVVSAMAVPWIFGCAVLYPVYLLLKRFFDHSVTALGLLLFAVMPVFVDISCMTIKEPIAVFFAAWGFHFFLRHLEEGALKPLAFAGVCFMLASWARIEMLVFFGVSWGSLLFFPRRRLVSCAVLLSVLAGFVALAVLSDIATGVGLGEIFRSRNIIHFFSKIPASYEALRVSLKELAASERQRLLSCYLASAPNLLWFTAIGAILKIFVKTLFYPFAVFFAAGLPGAWRMARGDGRILYLGGCAAGGFLVLYFQELTRWAMFPRYMAAMTLPILFVSCCGMAAARDFLRTRARAGRAVAVGLLALVLVLVTVPKNFRARECDKLVFKEIGEAVAAAEGGGGPSMISASAETQRWVSFYANVGNSGPFPPRMLLDHWSWFPKAKKRFISKLHQRKIDFMLWDERRWGNDRFPIQELLDSPGVKIIGEWRHPDTGRMILLELKDAG